jgi:hypothetical protein
MDVWRSHLHHHRGDAPGPHPIRSVPSSPLVVWSWPRGGWLVPTIACIKTPAETAVRSPAVRACSPAVRRPASPSFRLETGRTKVEVGTTTNTPTILFFFFFFNFFVGLSRVSTLLVQPQSSPLSCLVTHACENKKTRLFDTAFCTTPSILLLSKLF